jgi:hypothetical protein
MTKTDIYHDNEFSNSQVLPPYSSLALTQNLQALLKRTTFTTRTP